MTDKSRSPRRAGRPVARPLVPLPAPLPMTRAEMTDREWDELDVLLVSGDAYVDHPSFGAALLGRLLESRGYRVGIVAQPRWDTPEDITAMGRPRLLCGVTAGALDSMLAHYTAFRKKRSDDAYTPGGRAGARPNRASIVYTGLVRQAFPGLPVVLGGIEASLRRATHFDFWSNKLRRSVLLDAKADVLVWGMGERALLALVERATAGEPLVGVDGTAWAVRAAAAPGGEDVIALPSHEDIVATSRRLLDATLEIERHVQSGTFRAVQPVGDRAVVFGRPSAPLDAGELDALYDLPFTRAAHPSYDAPVPAVEMIRFSVTSHRGCAGGCAFCSLAAHQGRRIRSRSADSIRREVETLTGHADWKGSVSDVGGPTANMWGARCIADPSACRRTSCLAPSRCRHFEAPQGDYTALLRSVARQPGVKHVRVASGVRHDLALDDAGWLRALAREFTGGQLKIAPEHISPHVLKLMRKPGPAGFLRFLEAFDRESDRAGKRQYVIPYLMSAFPGCTLKDMEELGAWLRSRGWRPQQVQCFIPTPGTVATAMFYCGEDPSGRAVQVARSDAERRRQHEAMARSTGKSRDRSGRAQRGPSARRPSGRPAGQRSSRPPRRGPRGRGPKQK